MMTDIMRTRISQLEDENRGLIHDLSDKAAKLRDALAAVEVVRVDAHQVIGQWAEDAKKSRLQCEELARTKTEIAQSLATAEARVHEVISINISQASRLQRLEKELEEAVNSSGATSEKQSARLQQLEELLQTRDAEIVALKSEAQRLCSVAAASETEAQKWEADCVDTLALVQSLRQERIASAAREADLSNLLCVSEGAVSSLSEQLASTQAVLQQAKENEEKMEKMSATAEEHIVLLAEADEKQAILVQEVQRLKNDVSSGVERMAKLRDELRAQDIAAEALLRENAALKTQLVVSAHEKSLMQADSSKLRQTVSEMQQELVESAAQRLAAAKRADDFESDVAEHLDTIESMKRVLQTLEEQLAWLRADAAASKATAENLQTEVDAVRAEFNRTHAENIVMKTKAVAASALETELRALVDAVRTDLRSKVSAAENSLKLAETTHAAERVELEREAIRISAAAKQEKDDLVLQLDEAKRLLFEAQTSSHQSKETLLHELSLLQSKGASYTAEIHRLEDKCHALESDQDRLRAEVQRKIRDANDSREQQKMAEHMLSQAVLEHQDERDRAAAATEALLLELRALKRAAEAAQERSEAADAESTDTRNELHKLRHLLISKDDALQRSEFERDSLVERNKNFERLLSMQNAVASELEAKAQTAEALRTERRSLQQDIAVLTSRLQQMQVDHERILEAKDLSHNKLEGELRVRSEQHSKLKCAFDEAKSRCTAAEEAAVRAGDELNSVIRNREEIIMKYNNLHDRYSLLKRQVQDGHASSGETDRHQPSGDKQRELQLEASLAKMSQICREQEGQLEVLRHEHRLLQRAMNMTRTTTATVEEFHKSSGLSVQNLNTTEGPRRHPRKRSVSQHGEANRPHRVESQTQPRSNQLN